METKSTTASPGALFNPLAGWEAATQWNAAAYDWMTEGWKQWWSLVTAPYAIASPLVPVAADSPEVRPLRNDDDKPAARARASDKKPKRSARPKKAGAKVRARG